MGIIMQHGFAAMPDDFGVAVLQHDEGACGTGLENEESCLLFAGRTQQVAAARRLSYCVRGTCACVNHLTDLARCWPEGGGSRKGARGGGVCGGRHPDGHGGAGGRACSTAVQQARWALVVMGPLTGTAEAHAHAVEPWSWPAMEVIGRATRAG